MSRLEVLIGVWNTTGEVLETESAPPTTLTATDSYRWIPGKHFIVHDTDARFGTTPARSLEIIGYDRVGGSYTARSYDDQGTTDVFEVALSDRRLTIVGESVRFSGEFNADHSQLTGSWEQLGKKSGWQPWIKLNLLRAE